MKFIKKYWAELLIVLVIMALVVVFFIPFCIGMARDMWQWALYGTI